MYDCNSTCIHTYQTWTVSSCPQRIIIDEYSSGVLSHLLNICHVQGPTTRLLIVPLKQSVQSPSFSIMWSEARHTVLYGQDGKGFLTEEDLWANIMCITKRPSGFVSWVALYICALRRYWQSQARTEGVWIQQTTVKQIISHLLFLFTVNLKFMVQITLQHLIFRMWVFALVNVYTLKPQTPMLRTHTLVCCLSIVLPSIVGQLCNQAHFYEAQMNSRKTRQ